MVKKKKKKKKKISYIWCYDNNVHVTAVVCPNKCMEQPQNVSWPRPGPHMCTPKRGPHPHKLIQQSLRAITPHPYNK